MTHRVRGALCMQPFRIAFLSYSFPKSVRAIAIITSIMVAWSESQSRLGGTLARELRFHTHRDILVSLVVIKPDALPNAQPGPPAAAPGCSQL